jgi:hypothetical protein
MQHSKEGDHHSLLFSCQQLEISRKFNDRRGQMALRRTHGEAAGSSLAQGLEVVYLHRRRYWIDDFRGGSE